MKTNTNSFAYLLSKVSINYTVEVTESFQSLKDGTKTIYIEEERVVREVTREEYARYIDDAPWWRKSGWSATVTPSYVSPGYVPVRLVLKSPDRERKIVRTFNFTWS
jgi:hypothetical protein